MILAELLVGWILTMHDVETKKLEFYGSLTYPSLFDCESAGRREVAYGLQANMPRLYAVCRPIGDPDE